LLGWRSKKSPTPFSYCCPAQPSPSALPFYPFEDLGLFHHLPPSHRFFSLLLAIRPGAYTHRYSGNHFPAALLLNLAWVPSRCHRVSQAHSEPYKTIPGLLICSVRSRHPSPLGPLLAWLKFPRIGSGFAFFDTPHSSLLSAV